MVDRKAPAKTQVAAGKQKEEAHKKQHHEEEHKIDTNLYSRQIGTYGMETMTKLIKMNVLIVGMRGLGAETAKNLILAGPHSVTLYDPHPIQWGDLSANFYLKEKDVMTLTTRAQASHAQLQELNPYVKVKVVDQLKLEDHRDYHVVVYTELFQDLDHVIEVDELCRKHGIGFILGTNFGPSGFIFLDYGDEFVVTDPDGEETKSFIVVSATQSNPCIVTVHEDKRHIFQSGDHVQFREVQGMTQLNSLPPTEIEVIDGYSFRLKVDASKFGAYTREGQVQNIKMPQKISFMNFKDALLNPSASQRYGCLDTPDFRLIGRSEALHFSYLAYFEYYRQNKRYPNLSISEYEAIQEYYNYTTNLNQEYKNSAKPSDPTDSFQIWNNVARFAQTCISPMAAFFGGIIAQEVVKFTGKYSPLKQWLHYDIFETLPSDDNSINREPLQCRYDDQIRVYGRDVQQQLNDLHTFMVGAGALGCELIKAFALMGVGCSEEGRVSVTDNDNIEVSNLNRQFLFRKSNVGQSKSKVACEIARNINPALNVMDYQTRVGTDTEQVFNDLFWNKQDFVVNAVDNINARLYVDGRCVWYNKPLLESGTLGTKANMQMILPHQTQCYGDSQDPPEEGIPMCTLRNFPNQIEHCIEWGRDLFSRIFHDQPNEAVNYLTKPNDYVNDLKKATTLDGVKTTLEEIRKLLNLKKTADFLKCIELARHYFDEHFDLNIQSLVHTFPENHKDKDGQPFWSGPKRFPHAQPFNHSDQLHVQFIIACANLIAYNLGLPQNKNHNEVAQKAGKFKTPAYKPKTVHIELEESKQAQPAPQQIQQQKPAAGQKAGAKAPPELSQDEKQIMELLKHIKTETGKLVPKDFIPAEFEKDDDTNYHIEFIHAASNLRARNYKIIECDHQKTKMIAGKIIPAIATTTAMITGCVTAQIYNLVQGHLGNGVLTKYKDAFINLALPTFIFSEPNEVKKIKSTEYDPIMMSKITAIPEDHTIYDKIIVMGPLTVEQLLAQMKARFNIEICMIGSGKQLLYNQYAPKNAHAPRLGRLVEEIYKESASEPLPDGRNYLCLEVSGTVIGDGSDFSVPSVKYKFKY